MKKFYLKTLLLAAVLLGGAGNAWADDITSLPYTADFSESVSPFDVGSVVSSNTSIGSVYHLTNTTATAWFDADAATDGKQAYQLAEKETVTVQFTAFHGWLGNGGNVKIQLLNSGGVSLVEYTYNSNSTQVTDVKLGGSTPSTFSAFSGQSKNNASRSANGLGGNGRPYVATENYNPTVTMAVAGNGFVTFTFKSANAGEKSYSAALPAGTAIDLAKIVIEDKVNNDDRSTCIDDLSITSVISTKTTYSYTIKSVDENNEEIVSETGVGDEGTTVEVSKEMLEYGGKKYDYVSDDAAANTLTADGKVITIKYKERAKYAYAVNAVDKSGKVLKALGSGSAYEGDGARVYYPHAVKSGDLWYTVAPKDAEPYFAVDFTEAGTVDVTYAADASIVYYFEGDELNTTGWAAGTGTPARMSNGDGSRLAGGKSAYTEALAAGTYDVTVKVRNQRGAVSTEGFASLALRDAEGETTELTENFEVWTNATLEERTISGIAIEDGLAFQMNNGEYNSNLEIDYIIFATKGIATLESSANLKGYKTFYSAEKNYEVDANTDIYVATATGTESVTLTKMDGKEVPAGSPVILKTSAADYVLTLKEVERTAAVAFAGNRLKAAAGGETNKYILGYAKDGLGFYQYTPALTAGEVYVEVPTEAKGRLGIEVADEATAISAVAVKAADAAMYNVAGQRVGADYKGIVIKNGKKYLNK